MQFKPNALQHNDALLTCYSLFMGSGGFVMFVKYFSAVFFNLNYLIQLYFILYIINKVITCNYMRTATH